MDGTVAIPKVWLQTLAAAQSRVGYGAFLGSPHVLVQRVWAGLSAGYFRTAVGVARSKVTRGTIQEGVVRCLHTQPK